MSQLPSAPRPLTAGKSRALQGTVSVPGDKSISHRALILGALAEGRTDIAGLLESEDILCTARALQQLGADIRKEGIGWTVIGSGLGGLIEPASALDFGNSGTGARLMMGIVAGHPMRAVFTGDESLKKRPMGRVLDPLKKMGLQIEEQDRATLPLTLVGSSGLVPIEYRLPVPSAQVKSAILLAGLLTPGRTSVVESEKTRDHTEKMLSYFGASVSTAPAEGGTRITVEGCKTLHGKPVTVPGDPSSAAFLAAAAILCPGSDILIRNVLVNPTRTGFYLTLKEMGAGHLVRKRTAAERRAGRGFSREGGQTARRSCSGGTRAFDDRRISDACRARRFCRRRHRHGWARGTAREGKRQARGHGCGPFGLRRGGPRQRRHAHGRGQRLGARRRNNCDAYGS